MDSRSAGVSGKYTRSGNDYNQPNDHARSSRRGRYRYATVRQWDHPPAMPRVAMNFTILLAHVLLNISRAVQ
ncbi:hypothetical protein [Salinisphaera sp. G21_0]|uniref:hypothetical protein n=1 Tax=Salinisphaera sp. G21_0 TaxID=2821094 RepID=UPI001ADBD5D1|nr:hypothetical protein [Salinisphaera sp. G21_0]MBO9481457.1 hypothetical protein [Salinisphaera sp. G21_0]